MVEEVLAIWVNKGSSPARMAFSSCLKPNAFTGPTGTAWSPAAATSSAARSPGSSCSHKPVCRAIQFVARSVSAARCALPGAHVLCTSNKRSSNARPRESDPSSGKHSETVGTRSVAAATDRGSEGSIFVEPEELPNPKPRVYPIFPSPTQGNGCHPPTYGPLAEATGAPVAALRRGLTISAWHPPQCPSAPATLPYPPPANDLPEPNRLALIAECPATPARHSERP
mmetsp:Transcript_13462/g.29635  ORF Transcript_13462/g.29635 Transcript_13462/m.29635 type:complete len:227 (-) Transcript_13462:407-1087(-)